jgi:hypothetical protein
MTIIGRGLDVPGRMAASDNDARCGHGCPCHVRKLGYVIGKSK